MDFPMDFPTQSGWFPMDFPIALAPRGPVVNDGMPGFPRRNRLTDPTFSGFKVPWDDGHGHWMYPGGCFGQAEKAENWAFQTFGSTQ